MARRELGESIDRNIDRQLDQLCHPNHQPLTMAHLDSSTRPGFRAFRAIKVLSLTMAHLVAAQPPALPAIPKRLTDLSMNDLC